MHRPSLPTVWSTLAAAFAISATSHAGRAQGRVELAPRRPLVQIVVRDLPGLRAAFANTAAARLLAEPEVADAVDLMWSNLQAQGDRWLALTDALRAMDPGALCLPELCEAEAWRGGATDLLDLQFGYALEIPKEGDAPGDMPAWMRHHSYLAMRPLPEAMAARVARLEAFQAELRQALPPGNELAPDQTVFGAPGLQLAPGGNKARPEHFQYLVADAVPLWLAHRDGLLFGGVGAPPAFAALAAAPDTAPSLEVTIEPRQYMQALILMAMGWYFFGEEDYWASEWQLLGLDKVEKVTWRLSAADDRLQEEISFAIPKPATGILGAILQGAAPMPRQPLPDGALLQLRGGVDVHLLSQELDAWLLRAELPTLGDLGIGDDLRQAWTGGVALALVRPAPGSLMPRLYVSFGVADANALQRLLGKLWDAWNVDRKPRRYEDTDCTQLTLDGAPPGMQPTFAVVDDALHLAESPASLRALLRARAAGAPPALDVGAAQRPKGPGRAMPGLEVRFDPAAIHAALQQIWMPLVGAAGDENGAPLLPIREMPDVATVTEHLAPGRGVLCLDGDRLVLRGEGLFGGPTGQALVTALGPVVSRQLTQRFHYAIESLRARLACAQAIAIHRAIVAYEKRIGRLPADLGELVAAGDLPDVSLLKIEGDAQPEPVLHDGKQIAASSFRYYPKGLTVTPYDTQINAQLITAPKMAWWRIASDAVGTPHLGWGEFATQSLDALEKAAAASK